MKQKIDPMKLSLAPCSFVYRIARYKVSSFYNNTCKIVQNGDIVVDTSQK